MPTLAASTAYECGSPGSARKVAGGMGRRRSASWMEDDEWGTDPRDEGPRQGHRIANSDAPRSGFFCVTRPKSVIVPGVGREPARRRGERAPGHGGSGRGCNRATGAGAMPRSARFGPRLATPTQRYRGCRRLTKESAWLRFGQDARWSGYAVVATGTKDLPRGAAATVTRPSPKRCHHGTL